MVAAVVAVGAVAASAYSAHEQGKAGEAAAQQQSDAAGKGMDESRRQFDAVQKLLNPYVTSGTKALSGQNDLAGLNGADAQRAAIDSLQNSPEFTAMQQQGENRILANGSATGGLRGGNTQAALAQFSPQLLQQVIGQQYSRLSGLSQQGQSAAAGVGAAGLNTGAQISNLYQQQGAALAGGSLAQGKEQAGYANAISSGIGAYFGGSGGKF